MTDAEFRRLATDLAATVATVRDLAERLSPIPEKFAALSQDVLGMKAAVEGMQRRIETGDSAFEALRSEQRLQGERIGRLEAAGTAARSRAWELFVTALPWLGGAALAGIVLWIKSLGH